MRTAPTQIGIGEGTNNSTPPTAIVTMPDSVVAVPVTAPRCPLLTARPKTSFPESEDKERKIARQAKSATIVTPSEDPLSTNAATVMSAAQTVPTYEFIARARCDKHKVRPNTLKEVVVSIVV